MLFVVIVVMLDWLGLFEWLVFLKLVMGNLCVGLLVWMVCMVLVGMG